MSAEEEVVDYSTEEEKQKTERLKELNQCLDNGDFARAVELCEESFLVVLPSSSSKTKAKTEPVVGVDLEMIYEIYAKALLHLEEYTKLVEEVKPPSAEVRTVLEPLQAYAYYRLGQYERASTAAAASASSSAISSAAAHNHIKAQSLFYLHETQKALECYQDLLEQANKNKDQELTVEVLTNALAAITANATPYGTNDNTIDSSYAWLEQAQSHLDESSSSSNNTYAYDLAYNLASLQMLSSHTAAARHEALALLQQAQKQCAALSTADDNDDDNNSSSSEVEPILLQQHWARAFWAEVAAPPKVKSQHKLNGLLAQYINPMLFQDLSSKVLPAFLEKVLQTPKITALQSRLVQYNLALVYLQSNELDKCRQTLLALGQSLGSGDSTSHKKSKKKTTTTAGASSSSSSPPPTHLDALWWNVRVQILMAYSYSYEAASSNNNDNDSNEKEWKQVLQKLQDLQDKLVSLPESTKLRNHILLYLSLHRRHLQEKKKKQSLTEQGGVVKNSSGDVDDEQWLLSHKQFPAVTASLAQFYQQQKNQPEKAQALLSQHEEADVMLAGMALAQGDYQKAIELYQQVLANDNDNNNIVIRAKLVEALSHVDPSRACQEWKKMGLSNEDDDDEEESLDGHALELQELPRLQRQHASTAMVSANGSTATNNATTNAKSDNKGNKKSKAAILRRRAKKRQAHLEKLQQRGMYSPSKPIPPDPERWIPKAERQRRRRRGGGQQSKASQGSGYSSKDAAQLDVAARTTGQVEPQAHSTAHMSVAGGGDGRGKARRR